MLTNQEVIDRISLALDMSSDEELFQIWNEYCRQSNCLDDEIFRNTTDFFAEHYTDSDLWILIKNIVNGSYRSSDRYLKYSLCTGNIVSFEYITDVASPYDQSSLVGWLMRNHGDDMKFISDFIGCNIESED